MRRRNFAPADPVIDGIEHALRLLTGEVFLDRELRDSIRRMEKKDLPLLRDELYRFREERDLRGEVQKLFDGGRWYRDYPIGSIGRVHIESEHLGSNKYRAQIFLRGESKPVYTKIITAQDSPF